MDASKMGIVVSGLVVNKNEYIKKNGEMSFALDVAVIGNRDNIPVGCSQKLFNQFTEMQEFKMKVIIGKFNGNTFFNALET